MGALRKTALLGASSALALAGMTSGVAAAEPVQVAPDPAVDPVAQVANDAYYRTDIVTTDVVAGDFAFSQNEVSSNSVIAGIGKSASYMCNSLGHLVKDDSKLPEDWTVRVQGAVTQNVEMTFAEMAESDAVQRLIMACTCMANPTDGRATANAEVTGIPVRSLLEESGIREGANTIVFASADGYEAALPLSYVLQRYCPIVFDVNGAPLAESVGGTNQLWLGATSANYFVRDVTTITLEERQTPPPSPSSAEAREAYQNLPNVGVLYGGEVR